MLAWGGICDAELRDPGEPWPVHDDLKQFVLEGYRRGLTLDASNVDLDTGIALFALRKDARRWNEACVRQIGTRFGEYCEAINIVGCDPKQAVQKKPASKKTTLHGIQAPIVLTLRTCKQHRQRVMLLWNQAVQDGWANGTQARLVPENSWSGKREKLKKAVDGSFHAPSLELEPHKYTDFSVTVVRDSESTLRKDLQYCAKDMCSIGVGTETGGVHGEQFMQTQLALAYAMTVHKSQGLTMPKIYPSLQGIFGFGMPYTLMTRTRLAEDMIFVGVPPSDIYPLLKETSCQDEMYWNSALQSMVKVNEDFKIRYNDVVPKARREHQWRSLQQLLQGDHSIRLRIQYYKQIATKWMTDSGVNVLARCTQDKPLLPTR